jgi:type IV secretory pathway TraG/TraD family ATPase VirD4
MTRSGKTVLVRQLAASLKKQCRFVVYDDKSDLVPFLSAEPDSPAAPLYILNPFDSRSVAWDIAKDAYASHRADEIAQVLIPDQPAQNPYFVDTPRLLMSATISALNRRAPGKWRFLDLLIALEHVQTVLKHDEPSRRVLEQHLAAPSETVSGVISTLANHIRPFKTAAVAWSHATQHLSITEWARSATGTLVLGNHANYEYAMRNINRVLFHLLAQALLDPEMRSNKNPRTYIILDELHQLGTLEKLDPLLNQGAGLGINLVLGFQDIQTLRKHYGESTDGLIGQCAHYAFFRIGNPTTAHWASAILGTQEVLRYYETSGTVGDQHTTTTSHTHTERHMVPPTRLQQLPLTTSESGLTAYFASTCLPTYRGHIPGDLLFFGVRYNSLQEIPSSVSRDANIAVPVHHSPGQDSLSYLPLDPPSASGLSTFEPRPDEQLLFPEHHAPYLERLGFPPSTPSRVPQPVADIPPAQDDDFDPDDFPRLSRRST